MADHYTKLSFELDCTEAEADRLIAAFAVTGDEAALPADLTPYFPANDPGDPLSGVAALYDDADAFDIGARIDRRPGGVWIHGDGDPQVLAIAEFIRRLAPSSLPMGFTWANDCSRSRPGGFGGGYVLITRDDYDVADVAALLDEALEASRG
jgi:hypothetical protein